MLFDFVFLFTVPVYKAGLSEGEIRMMKMN